MKSITQAGQRMRVSQPAVSKMIQQLERNLGYALFRRSGRSLQLTTEGQVLFQTCIPIFKKLNEITTLQNPLRPDSKEAIQLGASDNLCNYVLPKQIQKFKKRFPLVQWNLFSGTSSEIKKRVLVGELDYGLFYTALSLSEAALFNETVLSSIPFYLAYSPKIGKFKNIAALNQAGLTYIGARESDYPSTSPEQWMHHRLGVKIDQTIQSNSKETQKQLVLAGLGFSILPVFMIEAELKKGALQFVPTSKSELEIRLITRKGEATSLILQEFLKQIF